MLVSASSILSFSGNIYSYASVHPELSYRFDHLLDPKSQFRLEGFVGGSDYLLGRGNRALFKPATAGAPTSHSVEANFYNLLPAVKDPQRLEARFFLQSGSGSDADAAIWGRSLKPRVKPGSVWPNVEFMQNERGAKNILWTTEPIFEKSQTVRSSRSLPLSATIDRDVKIVLDDTYRIPTRNLHHISFEGSMDAAWVKDAGELSNYSRGDYTAVLGNRNGRKIENVVNLHAGCFRGCFDKVSNGVSKLHLSLEDIAERTETYFIGHVTHDIAALGSMSPLQRAAERRSLLTRVLSHVLVADSAGKLGGVLRKIKATAPIVAIAAGAGLLAYKLSQMKKQKEVLAA